MKNGTEVPFIKKFHFENFISVVGNSNDENNFPQKLLLTNT